MINELDLLRMDERQRAAWLLANRATVIVVGLTWISMIVWELAHNRSPLFLVVMVPVFALFRGLLYLYYLRVTPAGSLAGACDEMETAGVRSAVRRTVSRRRLDARDSLDPADGVGV